MLLQGPAKPHRWAGSPCLAMYGCVTGHWGPGVTTCSIEGHPPTPHLARQARPCAARPTTFRSFGQFLRIHTRSWPVAVRSGAELRELNQFFRVGRRYAPSGFHRRSIVIRSGLRTPVEASGASWPGFIHPASSAADTATASASSALAFSSVLLPIASPPAASPAVLAAATAARQAAARLHHRGFHPSAMPEQRKQRHSSRSESPAAASRALSESTATA